MTTPNIDDAIIAQAAFRLWETEGRPDGRAQDHWFRARIALESPSATPDAMPAKPRAKAPRKTKAV